MPTAAAQSATLTVTVKYRPPGGAFTAYGGEVVRPDDELKFEVSLTNAAQCTSALGNKDATWDITTTDLAFWHQSTSDSEIATGTSPTVTGDKTWVAETTDKDEAKSFTITAEADSCGTGYTTPGSVSTTTGHITFDTMLPKITVDPVTIDSGEAKVTADGVARLPWSNNGDPDFNTLSIVSMGITDGTNLGETLARNSNEVEMTLGASPDPVDRNVPVDIRFTDPEGSEKTYTWQVPVDTIDPTVQGLTSSFTRQPGTATGVLTIGWDAAAADPDRLSTVIVHESLTTDANGAYQVVQTTQDPDPNVDFDSVVIANADPALHYKIQLVDEAGNVGGLSDIVSPLDLSLTSHATPDARVLPRVLTSADAFSGTVDAEAASVRIGLFNATDTTWLSCDASGEWVADRPACSVAPSQGTWSFSGWTGVDLGPGAGQPALVLTASNADTVSGIEYTFKLDPDAPEISETSIPQNFRTIEQNERAYRLHGDVEDQAGTSATGLKVIGMQFLDTKSNPVANFSSGALLRDEFACLQPTTVAPSTVCTSGSSLRNDFDGNVTGSPLAHVPIGEYKLRFFAEDAAGNVAEATAAQNLKVLPRIHVPASASISLDGRFTGFVWAGYSNHSYQDGSTTIHCDASRGYLCPVTDVKYYAWDPANNEYRDTPFMTVNTPATTAVNRSDVWYYDYSGAIELTNDLASLAPFKFKTVATAEIPKPAGGAWKYESVVEGLFAKREGVPDIDIRYPEEWAINTTAAPGGVVFNASVSFAQWEAIFRDGDGVLHAPYLKWWLEDLNDPSTPFVNMSTGNRFAKPEDAQVRRDATGTWCNCASGLVTARHTYNYSADLHRATLESSKLKAPDVPANVWKNNVTLPPGEYKLHIHAFNPAEKDSQQNDRFLTFAERGFAVEPRTPSVRVDRTAKTATGENVTQVLEGTGGDDWVKRSFRVMVHAEAGFGNFTDGEPTVSIRRHIVPGNTNPWIPVTFNKASDIVSESGGEATRTVIGFVTVPSTVEHGHDFSVYFNFTTDLSDGSGGLKNATGPRRISATTGEFALKLDEKAPETRVHNDASSTVFGTVNASGFESASGPGCHGKAPTDADRVQYLCTFYGPATDDGSGVKNVEVRIVDVQEDLSWHPNLGWLRADGIDFWQPAELKTVSGDSWWRYGSKALHENLSRFRDYRVDVRSVDHLGNVEPEESFLVRFDAAAPKIKDVTVISKGSTTLPATNSPSVPFVSWQGRKGPVQLFANVTDDACVARIQLVVENASSGAEIGRYAIPHPVDATKTVLTEADCAKHGSAASQVTVNARVPAAALDRAGTADNAPVLRMYLRVTDVRGVATNLTDGASTVTKFHYRVIDDFGAKIESGRSGFTPRTAGVGGLATLKVQVFENYRMGSVQVKLYRLQSGQYDVNAPIASGFASPSSDVAANGTGNYTITTRELGVELEKGDYAAHVIVRDAERRGSDLKPLFLTVKEGAAPTVALERPPEGTLFVNETPHVYAVVYSTNMTASRITVLTGDTLENLTAVTDAVKLPEGSEGHVGAYHVWYNTTVPEGQDTFAVRVHAEDVSGIVAMENATYIVDRVAPTVNASFEPAKDVNGTLLLNADSRVHVNATDNESGIGIVSCAVDDGAAFDCAEPASLAASDGDHVVTVTVHDRVGNAAEVLAFNVTVDKTPPTVNIAASNLSFLLTVDDAASGIDTDRVTLFYSTEETDPSSFIAMKMERVTGNTYRADLPEATQWFHVEVHDVAGNKATKFSASAPGRLGATDDDGGGDDGGEDPDPVNTPPALEILEPANGATLRTPINVKWSASDADGDIVEITILYEDASGDGRVVASSLAGDAGAFPWDASILPDGAYTLIVRASDGTDQTERTVTFSLKKSDPVKVHTPPRSIVKPGEQLTFAVEVSGSKTVKTVRAVIMKDGQEWRRLALEPQPQANVYGLSLEPGEAGKYAVYVTVEYQDGTSEKPLNVGSFTVASVQGDPIDNEGFRFTMQLGLLMAVSVLTIALAGWSGFVRWKQ